MTHSASFSHHFPHYRMRNATPSAQPRYIVAKRLNSVRLNWFMFGILSGMTLCFIFNLLLGSFMAPADQQIAAKTPTAALTIEVAQQEAEKADPTPFGIASLLGASDKAPAPSSAPEAEAEAESNVETPLDPSLVTHKLKPGETLANILVDQGIDYSHAHSAIEGLKKKYDPRGLRAGQEITLKLDKTEDGVARLDELRIATSPIKSIVLERSGEERFIANVMEKSLAPKLTLAGGTITNSLFETGYANGIPDGVLAELVNAYSYDVDFQREIQRGDQVEVLFEKLFTDEGDEAGYGDIVYATLKIRGKPISIYHYEDSKGDAGFFNEKGESVKKALLKTPVNGARISSGFGKRRHPILGYSKMHTGTDFAAATGTPIYASGDGVVTYKGRKGGYGNYIQIKHNGTYQSAYAHMHRFAKNMRNGKRVKQGEVIGYVGSTGRSTGPHLHYEVIKNGRKVNPLGEKFKAGKVLKGTELANFKQSMTKIKQQVASMPRAQTTVASVQ